MKRNLLALFIVFCVTGFGFAQEKEPVVTSDSPTGAAGDLSVTFKGVSSLGAEDPDGLLNIIEGPITVETWIKMDDYADNYTGFVSWGFTYKMGITNTGLFVFTFYGIVDIVSEFDLTAWEADGEWHHLASVWEPGVGVTFYADGEDVGFVEETRAPREPTTTNFTIGGENVGNVPFTGAMDRVRIHNAVLTAADLDSVASAPKAPLSTTLAHYGFDEGAAPFTSTGSVSLDMEYQNEVVFHTSHTEGWELFK